MRYLFTIVTFFFFGNSIHAQHHFDGYIDNERWQSGVYLSVIEDYRTIDGINDEQIISKVESDASGYFKFEGNQLESQQKIYKLHVDNCEPYNQASNHFDGHCADSRDILFIAKNTDSITFPLSFEAQMFCDIISNNPKTASFIKIDSLKEEMKGMIMIPMTRPAVRALVAEISSPTISPRPARNGPTVTRAKKP